MSKHNTSLVPQVLVARVREWAESQQTLENKWLRAYAEYRRWQDTGRESRGELLRLTGELVLETQKEGHLSAAHLAVETLNEQLFLYEHMGLSALRSSLACVKEMIERK